MFSEDIRWKKIFEVGSMGGRALVQESLRDRTTEPALRPPCGNELTVIPSRVGEKRAEVTSLKRTSALWLYLKIKKIKNKEIVNCILKSNTGLEWKDGTRDDQLLALQKPDVAQGRQISSSESDRI